MPHLPGKHPAKYKTIDEYIALFPRKMQGVLRKVRNIIREEAPDATEAIAYGIPTFRLHGNLVHFAGYESHLGLYPTSLGITAFKQALGARATGRGTAQFQWDKPIPYDLIRRIVKFRVKENLARSGRK